MTSSNQIQDFTAEYLRRYDKIFDDDQNTLPPGTARAVPGFMTGCSNLAVCAGFESKHCIFDKYNRDSLLPQGKSSGWDRSFATVELFAYDAITGIQTNRFPRNCKVLHLPRPSKSKQHLFFYKKKRSKKKTRRKGTLPREVKNTLTVFRI